MIAAALLIKKKTSGCTLSLSPSWIVINESEETFRKWRSTSGRRRHDGKAGKKEEPILCCGLWEELNVRNERKEMKEKERMTRREREGEKEKIGQVLVQGRPCVSITVKLFCFFPVRRVCQRRHDGGGVDAQ